MLLVFLANKFYQRAEDSVSIQLLCMLQVGALPSWTMASPSSFHLETGWRWQIW